MPFRKIWMYFITLTQNSCEYHNTMKRPCSFSATLCTTEMHLETFKFGNVSAWKHFIECDSNTHHTIWFVACSVSKLNVVNSLFDLVFVFGFFALLLSWSQGKKKVNADFYISDFNIDFWRTWLHHALLYWHNSDSGNTVVIKRVILKYLYLINVL